MTATATKDRTDAMATTPAAAVPAGRLGDGSHGVPAGAPAERPVFVADHPWRHRAANATVALAGLALLVWLLAIIAGAMGFGSLPAVPLVPHGGSSGPPAVPGERGPAVRADAEGAGRAATDGATAGAASVSTGAVDGPGDEPGATEPTASRRAAGGVKATPIAVGAPLHPSTQATPTGREHAAVGTRPAAPETRGSGAGGQGAPAVTPSGREIPQEPQVRAPDQEAGGGEATGGEARRPERHG